MLRASAAAHPESPSVLLALGLGSLPGMVLSAAADRFSRRVIASVGAGCYAVALALFAWAPGATALVLAALLLGAGSTGMVDGVEVALTDLGTSDRLRVWLARSNLSAVIGGLARPPVLAGLAFVSIATTGRLTPTAPLVIRQVIAAAESRLRAELTPMGDGLRLRLVVAPFGRRTTRPERAKRIRVQRRFGGDL